MNSPMLKLLLVVYIFYSLLKFMEFFIRSDENKAKGLYRIYVQGNGSVIKIFDNVILIFMVLFLVLLFMSGVEYVSFTTGLLVGMTVIQVFFHRFSVPLPPEQSPSPPLTALKMMSYSIQASPGRAWREILFITLLLTWSLYMLATRGFGLFS